MRAAFSKFVRAAWRHPGRAAAAVTATTATGLTTTALAHGVHPHSHDGNDRGMANRLQQLEQQVAHLTSLLLTFTQDVNATTGQGKAVFSWDRGLTECFPEDAKPFEKNLHGGFNEDPKTGVVYTGIPGYGLCRISPDLKRWTRFGDDERLKGNIHGIVVFEYVDGRTLIAVAQNDDQRVLIINPEDGAVLQELGVPNGGEFNFGEANKYYSSRPVKKVPWGAGSVGQGAAPAFAVTDVTYLDGKLYCVTGYCEGDFVLTATATSSPSSSSSSEAYAEAASADGELFKWGPVAWGGKGDAAGQFRTAHGVFAYDGHIFVANREAHEVIEFTPTGELVRVLPDIPAGARICNVARAEQDDMFVFNALEPIPATPQKTAPIYAHSGERLLSTIEPGELGIPVLKHLHHVWPHYVTQADGSKQLYLLVSGWSKGKFAVLKHEPGAPPTKMEGWDLRPGHSGLI